jgi:hypothetical protein
MSTTSGKNGKVFVGGAEVADIREWQLQHKAELKPYNSSSTAGHTQRVVGRDDWSASFLFYSAGGGAPFSVGDQLSVQLVVDSSRQPPPAYSGVCFAETIRPTVNIETGDIVGVAVTVGGHGALTTP